MLKTIIKIALVSAIFIAAMAPAQSIYDHAPMHVDSSILKELRCLELNLHHEARGESIEGIKAVANVTINRVKSGKFPTSICKVVKQPGQFSWVGTETDKKNISVDPTIRQIAFNSLLSNEWTDNTKGALYFHNKTVDNFNRPLITKIGGHVFYR